MANENNQNNQNQGNRYYMKNYNNTKVDPLGFNGVGLPLTAGVYSVDYKSVLNKLTDIARYYLGNDVNAKIEYWVDNESTNYDPETKRHTSPNRVSFQVWMKRDNPNITKSGDGNEFVDSVISYSENLKTFIRYYGIDNDQNIKSLLNKRGNAYVILVDPAKLFAIMFDMNASAYKDATGDSVDRFMEIRAEALYDNEDPIKALRNIRGRKRERPELTGFLVIKTYGKLGSFSNGTFRPAFNTHKDKDRDRDEDRGNDFKKKFNSI